MTMETLKKIIIETQDTKPLKKSNIEKLYNEVKAIQDANPLKYDEKVYGGAIITLVFLIIGLFFSGTLHIMSYLIESFNSSPYPSLTFLFSTIIFSFLGRNIYKEIKKMDKVKEVIMNKINNYNEHSFKEDKHIYGTKIQTIKFDGGFNDQIKYTVKKNNYVHEIKFYKKSEGKNNYYKTVDVIGYIEDIENTPEETIFKVRVIDTDINIYSLISSV
jgi:hypothetical protein